MFSLISQHFICEKLDSFFDSRRRKDLGRVSELIDGHKSGDYTSHADALSWRLFEHFKTSPGMKFKRSIGPGSGQEESGGLVGQRETLTPWDSIAI
jgi:hypothetical protein